MIQEAQEVLGFRSSRNSKDLEGAKGMECPEDPGGLKCQRYRGQKLFFFESGKCGNCHIVSALWQFLASEIE